MWHKLFSVISFAWSKLWSPFLAASITAGFIYALKRREERRELRRKLSAEIYIPARQQLSDAAQLIRDFKRAFSINAEMWKRACATGVADKLKQSVREQLRVLYENIFPSHDKAWMDLSRELPRRCEEWDSKYADIRDARALGMRAVVNGKADEDNIVAIDWWTFLVGDPPVTPIDGLREGYVLRIFNGFMTPARFKLLDLSVEQFLVQRWHEMSRNDALRQYRDLRQRALAEIPKAVACLDRETLY